MKKTYTSQKKALERQFKGLASTYTSKINCAIGMVTTPDKQADLKNIKAMFKGSSAGVQCERLMMALARYSVTTYEAMRYLDVYHCPARVLQLRKRGYAITTHWEIVITESGDLHKVGRYVLDSQTNQLHTSETPNPPKKPIPVQLALMLIRG